MATAPKKTAASKAAAPKAAKAAKAAAAPKAKAPARKAPAPKAGASKAATNVAGATGRISQIIGAAGESIDHPDRGAHRLRKERGGDRKVFVVGVRHPDGAKARS